MTPAPPVGPRRRHRPALAVASVAAALLIAACGGSHATPTAGRSSSTVRAMPSATAAPTATPGTATATATSAPSPTAPPPASDVLAYVAVSDGEVVPVDVTTATAEAPLQVDPDPTSIAISPDGHSAFVGDGDAATVTGINLVAGTVGSPDTLAGNAVITALAVTPNGATLLAVVNPTGYSTGSVIPITVTSGTAGTAIPVGADPVAIAVTPDGSTAYVVNAGDGTLTPISLATDSPGAPISVGVAPRAIAIAPGGGTAYVLGGNANASVTPVTLAADPAHDTAGAAISVPGGTPTAIALTPDGTSAFVVGSTGAAQIALPAGNALWTTSSAEYTAAASIPDGTRVLLGYTSGARPPQGLTVLSVSTDASGTPVALSGEPVSIAVRPS